MQIADIIGFWTNNNLFSRFDGLSFGFILRYLRLFC